jgi:hypothetical protein
MKQNVITKLKAKENMGEWKRGRKITLLEV